jgi:hypothetical protein
MAVPDWVLGFSIVFIIASVFGIIWGSRLLKWVEKKEKERKQ